MAKATDYTTQAAEFLKAWQTQMTNQMHNPDVIAAMLAAMQSFGAKTDDQDARKPSHAPDAGDDAIRQLTRRIDGLERELAALHARLLSLAAQTKNPARAGNGRHAKPVAAIKRPVAKAKRGVAAKPKPAAKRTKK
jgi:hypothetical protein